MRSLSRDTDLDRAEMVTSCSQSVKGGLYWVIGLILQLKKHSQKVETSEAKIPNPKTKSLLPMKRRNLRQLYVHKLLSRRKLDNEMQLYNHESGCVEF
jgi:hypothetical protein